MVKFEAMSGREVFISPERALAVEHAHNHGTSVIHLGTGINVVVKGTPEEVHAKLFPPVDDGFGMRVTERNEAMLEVLECVAEAKVDDYGHIHLPETAVALARKALGREGA